MNDSDALSQVGLVGLAVMGQNLALNIARHGFPIAVYNRTAAVTDAFLAESVGAEPVAGARSLRELVARLARPRVVLLLVKAGAPVDEVLAELTPLLEAGDIVVDAGNSHPADTVRRGAELASRQLRFVGMGVSGGEAGALNGPSLMPGGPRDAYEHLEAMLRAIAAQVEDGPCVTYLGPGAAGHYVKMVHNGIEYADMQLIAEAHDFLGRALGLNPAEQAAVFARWNEGPLESFLVEITAAVLAARDPDTGQPMVDVILDRAGQKGTGRWTAASALELGVPVPTIQAGVDARALSALLPLRRRAAALLPPQDAASVRDHRLLDDLADALYASKVCAYAQGMHLLRSASAAFGFDLDLAEVARIWKGGCIIRARLLDHIHKSYRAAPDLENLLLDPALGGWAAEHQRPWREVIGLAAANGIPVLAMGASLAYFDSCRRQRLPQSLTQAQRDYFGAHRFERVDRREGELFHADWDAP